MEIPTLLGNRSIWMDQFLLPESLPKLPGDGVTHHPKIVLLMPG